MQNHDQHGKFALGNQADVGYGHPTGMTADTRIKKSMPKILDNLVEKALYGDPIAGAAVINYQLYKERK